jgi:hypothetical protein
MAQRAIPYLVRLLAHDNRQIAIRAAQTLAGFGGLSEIAYAPIWMENFAGPRMATEIVDAFVAGLSVPISHFIKGYREHVHYFVESSSQVQSDRLQETSLLGLEQSDYRRAFLVSALCHPALDVREVGLRVVQRLNWNISSVPSEVRLAVESALAFSSTYYLSPQVKPDDRFQFLSTCEKFRGSAALSRIVMDFASKAEEAEVVGLVSRAALLCPSESAAEAVVALADRLESGVKQDVYSAATRLANLSVALPEPYRGQSVQALCAALRGLLAQSDVNAEECGALPKMVGLSGGDPARIVEYCSEILRSRQDSVSEYVVAAILVRLLGRIGDQALPEQGHHILRYLSTSSDEAVQSMMALRRSSYPSGPITRGLR